MSFGYLFPPHPGQIQPGLLSASALAEPHSVLPCLHPKCGCGTLPQPQTCQSLPLETGPCCDFKSPFRRSGVVGFFFFPLTPPPHHRRIQETVKVSWKEKILCQEKEVQTLFSAFKSRACGFRCVFFFFLMSFD